MTVRARQIQAWIRKGRAAFEADRLADALSALTHLVRARPESAAAHYDLARAHFFFGEVGRATRHLRKAIRTRPDLEPLAFLATIAAFDPAMGPVAILRCRRAFEAALLARFGGGQIGSGRGISARKILRVGYVSSFFHRDNWMKPVWALIDHHNRKRVEVHLFSDAPEPAVARRRAGIAGVRFHDISRRNNADAVSLIARNRIDILVDLNGYSKVVRFPIFQARPAPLVVAWFNIFGTTGMSCFDALIGDPWVIRDDDENWYAERLVELPLSSLTFQVTYPVPRVQPPPCLRNGFVTFGSLASLYKMNDQVVAAWAEILRRCPGARLILGSASLGDEGNREHTLRRFTRLGVGAERITLSGGAPHYDFLKKYDAIDIALDPFPYNGGTTTTEAIWQGVPVLTFTGDRWISRTSATILCNAGLEEFVCKDVGTYVEAAVKCGSSPNSAARLRKLRAGIRTRLRKTPVYDAARLAACMEDVYRDLWQTALERKGDGT